MDMLDVLNNSSEKISIYDSSHRLIHHTPSLTSLRKDVAPGKLLWDIYADVESLTLREAVKRVIGSGREEWLDMPDGSPGTPSRLCIFRVGSGVGLNEQPVPSIATAASALDEGDSSTLLYHATHDVLTGLENRRQLTERLRNVLHDAPGDTPPAFLQIDLDNFKVVNDTLGHGAGDLLLQMAAERIRRTIDDRDFAYRYAGDEFAVVQLGKPQPASAERLASDLIAAFQAPFLLNGLPIFVGASVGIAHTPDHGRSSEELMKAADIALYAAKRDGRGCARVFSQPMQLLIEQRENLRRKLRGALANGELFLEYQPLVQPTVGVVGFEALLRWRHPELGLIPPGIFIPIAETDGLMDEIGAWVLRRGCEQARAWPPTFSLAVNVSSAQFLSGGITDTIAHALDASELHPDRLEVEITESVLLEKTVDNLDTLNTLNVLGIRISLDDFGKSYSSLSYLKNFPFDTMKIDQYFISDIRSNVKSQIIVRSVLDLAHGLGMTVTAEGVEMPGQAEWLADAGCDRLQGYYLGRPMPADATLEFIRRTAGRSVADWPETMPDKSPPRPITED
ncbi:EAL domain-containing protein [Ancylobacter sp. 6x-1]|uniref:EAL domain-containing protein n=1 Tax=Ancylobacter crimeensis TaxID=2579147 RepID=A0ABT0D761_9HYPH|nr:EAL domain-containing protein [Ancylobacter crimeensis]MCK0195792.1 EAL domain-containing protein [Ancylobacter crimeensis]